MGDVFDQVQPDSSSATTSGKTAAKPDIFDQVQPDKTSAATPKSTPITTPPAAAAPLSLRDRIGRAIAPISDPVARVASVVGKDALGAGSGLGDMIFHNDPGSIAGRAVQNAAETVADYQARKAEGRSPVYNALSTGVEATGAMNPRPMEEEANRGNTLGVIGHAILPAALATLPLLHGEPVDAPATTTPIHETVNGEFVQEPTQPQLPAGTPPRALPPSTQRALPPSRFIEAPASPAPPQLRQGAIIPPAPEPGIPDQINFLMGNETQTPQIPSFPPSGRPGPLEIDTSDRGIGNTHRTIAAAAGRDTHPLLPAGVPNKEPISGFHTGDIQPLREGGEPGVFLTTHQPGSVSESVAGSVKGTTQLKGSFALADVTQPQWKEIYDTAKSAGSDPAEAMSIVEKAIKVAGYDGYKNPQIPNSAFIFGDAKLANEATTSPKVPPEAAAGSLTPTPKTAQTAPATEGNGTRAKPTVQGSLPRRGNVFQQMPHDQLARQAEQGVEGAKNELVRRSVVQTPPVPAEVTSAPEKGTSTSTITPSERAQKITEVKSNEAWTTEQLKSEISRVQKITNNPAATEEERRIANNQLQHYQLQFGERQREDSLGDKLRDALTKKAPRGSNGRMSGEAGAVPSQVFDDIINLKSKSEAQYRKVVALLMDKSLRMDDKYLALRPHDPHIADEMQAHDNGPAWATAHKDQNMKMLYAALDRPADYKAPEYNDQGKPILDQFSPENKDYYNRERLAKLMSDADSRNDLQKNHAQEYKQAINDPRIMDAVRLHQKFSEELTRDRTEMGLATLPRDYSKRIYAQYPPTEARARTNFDQVVRPGRDQGYSREASADWFYEHGQHEFEPAYANKYIATKLMLQDHRLARDFMDKAVVAPERGPLPEKITYTGNGKTYYSPKAIADLAKTNKKAAEKLNAYAVYDPAAALKYPPSGTQWQQKYLGPRPVVEALNGLADRKGITEDRGVFDKMRRFYQEQVLNVGFPVHMMNILNKVAEVHPAGALNPKAWVDMWRVATSKELRIRAADVDDKATDMLLKYGGFTSQHAEGFRNYLGGNLNPANWYEAERRFGHKVLFEPGALKGHGGLDQAARVWLRDYVKNADPKISDAEFAREANTTVGNYSKLNQSEQRQAVSKFMLFPGWTISTAKFAMQHPIRTTIPGAVLVWMANRIINATGHNRDDEDRNDIWAIHYGNRSFGPRLLIDPMAKHLFRPAIDYAVARMRGESNRSAIGRSEKAARSGAGALASELRPELTGIASYAANRKNLFSTQELNNKDDYATPGKYLPTKSMENETKLALRTALPITTRLLDEDQHFDWKSYVGSMLGVPNYESDAKSHLLSNASQTGTVHRVLAKLLKTDANGAHEMLSDPENKLYQAMAPAFSELTKQMRKLDDADSMNDASNDAPPLKASRKQTIEAERQQIWKQADQLDKMMSERKQGVVTR